MAIKLRRLKDLRDTGFSNNNNVQAGRLVNNGRFNIRITGLPFYERYHLYQELIEMSWRKFIMMVLLVWTVLNLFFGCLYLLVGIDGLIGYSDADNLTKFEEAIFFSTQTLSTVGYGRINPHSLGANIIASLESLMGLMGFALVTGLLYGRFSRPVVKLKYSENALIAPFLNGRGLMFRVANKRNSAIIEPEVEVLASVTADENKRLFYNLKLERKKVSYLSLSWTIVHPIDEESVFYGLSQQEFEQLDLELLVTIKGFDTTFGTVVYSNYSYKFHELVFGAKFNPAFQASTDGKATQLMIDRINDYSLVEMPAQDAKALEPASIPMPVVKTQNQ